MLKNITLTIDKVDKIDVEEITKDFKVFNIDIFSSYLKEVWKVKFFF
jgi:hypothetical protein